MVGLYWAWDCEHLLRLQDGLAGKLRQKNQNHDQQYLDLKRGDKIRKKTLTKTRKFVVDGVVVTTTTSKVIYGEDDQMHDHVIR